MPYSTAADIPDNVKKLLKGPHEHKVWLAAWNAAYQEYNRDEQKAFAVAMAAVQKYRAKKAQQA